MHGLEKANLKRSAIGLAIALSVLTATFLVVELIYPRYHQIWSPVVLSARLALAIAAGSYYARGAFLAPAMVYVVVVWAVGWATSSRTRLPEGRINLVDWVISDLPNLLIGLGVAFVGTILGAALYRLRQSRKAIEENARIADNP